VRIELYPDGSSNAIVLTTYAWEIDQEFRRDDSVFRAQVTRESIDNLLNDLRTDVEERRG
jgi:hypothetical protein